MFFPTLFNPPFHPFFPPSFFIHKNNLFTHIVNSLDVPICGRFLKSCSHNLHTNEMQ